ncbi:MAG: enoyl-CoA hydratase-related protein, partial [Patescibacteria group bacterium]
MNTPTYETLQLVVDARGVARLTLNRPDTHNALNATLISELRRAVDWLAVAPGVRAVVLTGTGKTFCAGGDLG